MKHVKQTEVNIVMKKLISIIVSMALTAVATSSATATADSLPPAIAGAICIESADSDYDLDDPDYITTHVFDGIDALKITATVLALTVPFAAAIICLWLFLNYLRKVTFDRNRVVETAIREGRELPPAFFYILGKTSPERRFKAALLWIAWGLGLMIFFIIVDATPVVALMSIPVMIGVAKVVTYFMFDRKR